MTTRITLRFLAIFPFYAAILFVVNYFAFPRQSVGFFPYLGDELRATLPTILYFLAFSVPGFLVYHATRYRFSRPKPTYENIDSKTDPYGVEIKMFHAPLEMAVEYALWNRTSPVDFTLLSAMLDKERLDIPFDPACLSNMTAMEQGIFATLNAYPTYPADLSGYHGQSLLQHTFNVWAYARYKYPSEQSEVLAGGLTKHQCIHILAAAHDLGKLMSYQPSRKGGFTLVSTRHAMLSSVVLRQIAEYAELPIEARRVINVAMVLIDKNESSKPVIDNPSILLVARGCLHADAYVTQREITLRGGPSQDLSQTVPTPVPPLLAPIPSSSIPASPLGPQDPAKDDSITRESQPPQSVPSSPLPSHPLPETPEPIGDSSNHSADLIPPLPSSASAESADEQDVYSLGDTLSDQLPGILPKLNINRSISSSQTIDGIYKPEYGCVLVAQSSLIRHLAEVLPAEITNRYHLDIDQHATIHPASYDIANALREADWITFTVNNVTTDSGIFLVRSGKSPKSTPYFAFFTARIPEKLLNSYQPWTFELSIKAQLRTQK